ncbi:DUF3871 family protein [Elizabethkingia anophelis]|uniref:DUF3871 family protein n=1 Tax=Elizabethkingia anophelis TaxID=1117645 RepID=UPI0023E9595A|nr:DUF3871 family protein [Elizabethkingia anophelis]GJN63133.1 hypothetical protein ELAK_32830 [Elizabethkingia anophelis]HDP3254650.1 DUF3871 family protein [Elizabethkingia anophelis]
MEFQTKKYNISPISSNYGMPKEQSPVIQEQQESLKRIYNESAKEILRNEFTAMSEKEDRFVSRLTCDKSFPKPFIEANTTQVDLEHLKSDCIIPVFSKDNERTIAHQEFIDTVLHSLAVNYSQEMIAQPEIRVSHQIKGRIPEAIHKNAKDLLEHEKTIYYERMAFIIQIPSIVDSINGNELALTVGGVRSYSLENLYNKKSPEKFKFFIGFQNMVCCNLCVTSDGYVEEMKVFSPEELYNQVTEVVKNYNAERHLQDMKEFTRYSLTEHQFAQLIGKVRLYQHLPKTDKNTLGIPHISFNDSQFNTMAKDYYEDNSFCKDKEGNINLWNVYNLFTQANKSSYIDTFLDRNLNAYEFTKGIQEALNGDSKYRWFLS